MTESFLTPHSFDPELARFILQSRSERAALSPAYQPFLEAKHLLDVIEESGRFIEIVRRFRESEKTSSVCGPTAIHDAVYQVLHTMQYEFCFPKITLLKILPHDLPVCKIEKEHLQILLFHLLLHSREALGERGGIITIEGMEKIYLSPENSSRHRFILRVSHACLAARGEWTGRFTDYVEPLQPLDDPPETGGLYLARKITEYHRGLFRMELAGRVSSFHLEFPV